MTREEWVREFCEQIGVEPPSATEIAGLLDLAATAAHGSERPAAPLACWAVGRSGLSAAELLEAAKRVNP
jgi:hypothetical protein